MTDQKTLPQDEKQTWHPPFCGCAPCCDDRPVEALRVEPDADPPWAEDMPAPSVTVATAPFGVPLTAERFSADATDEVARLRRQLELQMCAAEAVRQALCADLQQMSAQLTSALCGAAMSADEVVRLSNALAARDVDATGLLQHLPAADQSAVLAEAERDQIRLRGLAAGFEFHEAQQIANELRAEANDRTSLRLSVALDGLLQYVHTLRAERNELLEKIEADEVAAEAAKEKLEIAEAARDEYKDRAEESAKAVDRLNAKAEEAAKLSGQLEQRVGPIVRAWLFAIRPTLTEEQAANADVVAALAVSP